MKSIFALAALVGAWLIPGTTPGLSQADPYRWCAQMSGGDDGGMLNCYFVTRAQCEATVAGIGGFCRLNQFYTGPETTMDAVPPPRADKKRAPR